MSTCSSARIASRFSVIETGSPAVRSSCTNPWRKSSNVGWSPSIDGVGVGTLRIRSSDRAGAIGNLQLLARLHDVGLVLEQHVQRLADHLGGDVVLPQVEERAGPVDRLRD